MLVRSLLLFPFAACAALAQTSTTVSGTFGQGYNYPVTSMASRTDVENESVDVPRFDPSLGRLVSVKVRHTSSVPSQCTMRRAPGSPGSGQIMGNAQLVARYTLELPDGSDLVGIESRGEGGLVPGTGWVTFVLPLASPTSATAELTSASMSAFVGAGSISLPLELEFEQNVTGGVPMEWSFHVNGSSTDVFVTYTYAPYWNNGLGNGLAGTSGVPQLVGSEEFGGGSTGRLSLTGGRADAAAVLVFGATRIDFPFLGGVLVPNPVASAPVTLDGAGAFSFDFVAGFPPGVTLFFQYWIADPVGVQGLAASNAVSGTS